MTASQSLLEQSWIFVGNRKFVLEEMLNAGMEVQVVVAAGSHLANDNSLDRRGWKEFESREQLLKILSEAHADWLMSNGCPHRLPDITLKRFKCVNIHPSFLPDLRGVDPTIGAVLLERDSGATCHAMDGGLDTGEIISQIKVPYSDDLDAVLNYQLSFMAEKEAFHLALNREFKPHFKQTDYDGLINYRRSPEDQIISFKESAELIIRKVRAFSNRSQGCLFKSRGQSFRVFRASLIKNQFLIERAAEKPAGHILLNAEACVFFVHDGKVVRFDSIEGPTDCLLPGQTLY